MGAAKAKSPKRQSSQRREAFEKSRFGSFEIKFQVPPESSLFRNLPFAISEMLRIRRFSSQAIETIAEYKRGPAKRGSAGIYESEHAFEVSRQYTRRQLRANFWGPKEWFYLARQRGDRLHGTSSPATASAIAQQLQQASSVQSDVRYPLPTTLSRDMLTQTRRTVAALYPSSSFAMEERVSEAWQHFVSGERPQSVLPEHQSVGGIRVRFDNPHQRTMTGVGPELISTCSEGAVDALRQISASCNPFEKPTVRPDFLSDFVSTQMQTKADVETILPAVLERWRYVCMGGNHSDFHEPNVALTQLVLDACLKENALETALHLLRYKSVYKLELTNEMTESLLRALAHRHIALAKDTNACKEPEQPGPLPPVKPLAYQGKRSLAKHAYPYRMVPRFYYYKPLPCVLDPEPSAFAEFPLPVLEQTNDNKRLLPDDRRAKLQRRMEMAQDRAQLELVHQPRESEALLALTQMYQLFHYATSKNPRYYGLEPSATVFDLLTVAGVAGGLKDGFERSSMAAVDAQTEKKLSMSGLSASDVAAIRLEQAPHQLQVSADSDRMGLGFVHAMINGDVEQLKAIATTSNVDTVLNEAFLANAAPAVAKALENKDGELRMKLKEALTALPQAQPLLKHEQVSTMLNSS